MGFLPVPGEGTGQPPISIPLPVPITGGGGGPGSNPGTITAALGGIVGWDQALAGWLQAYDNALISQLKSVLQTIFSQLASWLRRIANSWLGQTLRNVWNRLKRIYKAVADELRSIIKTIRQYEQLVQQWQNKILKPALDLIQRLRKILVIFRLFHFKFAIKLDDYLAAREAQLAKLFLQNRLWFNRIIGYLNFIVDPFGLVNQNMFFGSFFRALGDLVAGFKPNPAPAKQQLATSVEGPGWQNYNAVGGPIYARATLKNGPQGLEAMQLDQSNTITRALGVKPITG